MLLDQIDALSAQIGKLTTRMEELIAAIPAAQGVDPDGTTGPSAGWGAGGPVLPAVDRLDEVTGIGRDASRAMWLRWQLTRVRGLLAKVVRWYYQEDQVPRMEIRVSCPASASCSTPASRPMAASASESSC